jgi:predicted kinase
MKKVILTRGLPGSGKTTWAKQQLALHPNRYKRINKDDLRAMLDAGRHTLANEEFVLATRDLLITQALAAGYHVIVDDTNLHPQHEKRIRAVVDEFNQLHQDTVAVFIQDFTHIPLETCIKQDLQRLASVGEKVIRKLYNDFLKPTPAQPPTWNPALPKAILCDLDGTLSLFNRKHTRSPYDASTADNDEINVAVAEVLGHFYRNNWEIIFVSGRDNKYKAPTLAFLEKVYRQYIHPANNNNTNMDNFRFQLFMRKSGDFRKDVIIKREIYQKYIQPHYNVLFVLDDRDQIVEMWRNELGLTCFQVAYGDF